MSCNNNLQANLKKGLLLRRRIFEYSKPKASACKIIWFIEEMMLPETSLLASMTQKAWLTFFFPSDQMILQT